MYIDPVTRNPLIFGVISRTKPSAPRRSLLAATALISLLLLGGCSLFGTEPDPFIPKPATLYPEQDAFATTSVRVYTWEESLRRTGKADSLLQQVLVQAVSAGDTLVGDSLLPRLALSSLYSLAPAPVAAVTRLGFHPSRVALDTARLADPGPGLPFPASPVLGWRLDTTVGDLRFVRVLDRVETLNQAGKRQQCWAFAESTYWAGTSGARLGSGTTWMGATGIVRHSSEWVGFSPATATAGTLYRQIKAD